VYTAVAAPLVTVPEVTFVPCTVKVTVPTFTALVLVTVADNVTGWLLALKVAVALTAVIVVVAVPGFTVRLEMPVLPLKFALPL